MRTEIVFIVLNQHKTSPWLGTSASCFPQKGCSFWSPGLFPPASFTGWGVSWWGGDARTSRHVAELMPWLKGKENREESILCHRYSVKVFILLYCLYLQRAPECRAMYELPRWRVRAWGKAHSRCRPWTPFLESFLAWFGGSLGWWLSSWQPHQGVKGQPRCLGISHPIQGQALVFLTEYGHSHRDLASENLTTATSSAFIYVSDYDNYEYGFKTTNKLPCSSLTHILNMCPGK